MRRWGAKLIVCGMLAAATAGIAWTIRAGRLPRADFTFVNGTEIKSVDPAVISGQPEGRIVHALFEGLVNWDAQTLAPMPGVAEHWEISPDGLTYTFHLRTTARWSDDTPVTAHDFAYSFRRLLDPETAAEYAYQLWYLKNGRKYNKGAAALVVGDPVEIELHERPAEALKFARGRVLRGRLKQLLIELDEPDAVSPDVISEGSDESAPPSPGESSDNVES